MSCLKDQEQNCSSVTIGACLHYLVRQFDCLIDRRIQDLEHKKIGADLTNLLLQPKNPEPRDRPNIESFPYVIWVRMIKRPKILTDNEKTLFNLRGKFNLILEERILDGKPGRHRIMSIEVHAEEFDRQGNLTSTGKSDFWQEVDRAITKFDAGKISLLPRNVFNNPAKNKGIKKHSYPTDNSSSAHEFIHRITSIARSQNPNPENKRRKLMTPPPEHKSHRERRSHSKDETNSGHYHRHREDSSRRGSNRSNHHHHHRR